MENSNSNQPETLESTLEQIIISQEEAMSMFKHIEVDKPIFLLFRKMISVKGRFRHISEFVYLAYLIKSCSFLSIQQKNILIDELKPYNVHLNVH